MLFLVLQGLPPNWPSMVTAAVLIIIQIGLLGMIISNVAKHDKQIERLSLMLESHIASMTLHRTPDFEMRLAEFSVLLRDIKRDVEILIHQKE